MLPSPRRSAGCRAAGRRSEGRTDGSTGAFGINGAARRGRLARLTALTAALTLSAAGIAAAATGTPATVTSTAARSPAALGRTGAASHPAVVRTIVGAAAFGGGAAPIPAIAGAPVIRLQDPSPLSIAKCLQAIRLRCYSPAQYRVAYDLNPLYRAGITGKGRTIVIVDSFGSPTIGRDLAVFDKQWGFPDPTLNILTLGKIPPFNRGNAAMVGWAEETTLDVEYAHAIAPGANILLLETPVAETEGVTGFPEMMDAEQYVIDHNLGDVISQSFGATENTFPDSAQGSHLSLLNLRGAFENAARHDVTVLAASGDSGATNDQADGATLYPYRAISWPSSDPLVTSVGGTQLLLAQDGNKIRPDQVWSDTYGAGGGGVSSVFGRPSFQSNVASVVGDGRGTPDISMSAAVTGGCWVYESFEPSGTGWEILGGTSEATPIFAGVVALADQLAGHRLGNINAALYALGGLSQIKQDTVQTGIVDVTTGRNSYGSKVPGYAAGPGYDLASGWGTIDAARFVLALARVAG
ncbi:MAG: S53 family peptidase [Streptosporangiaceae bacterium]